MSAKINCPRKHQPRLCQLSVPRMGLIVVWCTNNGWRRRSTCPDNTIPHFIHSAQAELELDPSFKASQLSPEHKNHIGAAAGYSPSQALGRLETWWQEVCGEWCVKVWWERNSNPRSAASPRQAVFVANHINKKEISSWETNLLTKKNKKTKMDNCWTWD